MIESLFHSFDYYLIPDLNGLVKIWSISQQRFIDKVKKSSGAVILLTPDICEYSMINTRLSFDDNKNVSEYVEWHFKRELSMKEPVVDWVKTDENKLLCFACESETIDKCRSININLGTDLKGIDGVNTLVINSGRKISSNGENILISVIGTESIIIMGFHHEIVLFLRHFKVSNTFSFEKELMSTLAYYGFSPDKKLIFNNDLTISDEEQYYLFDDKIFGKLCNEKLSF